MAPRLHTLGYGSKSQLATAQQLASSGARPATRVNEWPVVVSYIEMVRRNRYSLLIRSPLDAKLNT